MLRVAGEPETKLRGSTLSGSRVAPVIMITQLLRGPLTDANACSRYIGSLLAIAIMLRRSHRGHIGRSLRTIARQTTGDSQKPKPFSVSPS